MGFVCARCGGMMNLIKKLCDEVETENEFCFLGDRLNASGSCAVTVIVREKIRWVRFNECEKLFLKNTVRFF